MTKDVKEFLEELIGKRVEQLGKDIVSISGDNFTSAIPNELGKCKNALCELNDINLMDSNV